MGLKFQPLLFSGFVSSSSGGSGPTIGGPITGGTDGSVLFVHPSGIIAQDNANFNFNDTTHALTITGNIAAATFNGYTPENIANKGVANGYAPLDGSTKIPVAYLPSVVMEYQGAWNPSTNTPTLSDGTGTNGNVYYVTATFAGPIGGLTDPSMHNFQIGDLVIYSASVGKWQLTTPAAGVQSVNGMQGVVVLTQGNLTDSTAGTDGITVTGGANAVWGTGTSIAQLQASGSQNGFLASTDWTTFNNKQSALTFGNISTSSTNLSITGGTASTVGPNVTVTLTGANLTDSTSGADGITVTNGTAAVLGTGTSIAQAQSSGSQNGYLSSTDWTTFNTGVNNAANKTLSNLTSPTSINQSLLPSSTANFNIGSNAEQWEFGFFAATVSTSGGAFSLNNQWLFEPFGVKTAPDGNQWAGLYNNNGPNQGGQEDWVIATLSGSIATHNTGNIHVETGNNNAALGPTGNINLRTGTPGAGGVQGKIQLQDGTQGTSGYVWTSTDTIGSGSWMPTTSGTVTSVALTAPSDFLVTGSPITSSGTLALTYTNQSINTVFAGPSSGGPGAPTFRALVVNDVPTLNQNTTGTAANITATSNSTLTTLSALSLPYSQITGTPTPLVFADSLVNTSGTVTLVGDTASPSASQYYGTNGSSVRGYYNLPASNPGTVTSVSVVSANGFTGTVATPTSTPAITLTGTLSGDVTGTLTATTLTATTNSTLTTLSALSLPTSQLSGVLTVPNGGTGNASFAINQLVIGGTTSTGLLRQVSAGTAGYVLTSNGGSAAPTFQPAPGTVSAFFASSEVTTDSTAISSTSFSTFDNSPAFTFTPTITGTYKVHSSASMITVGDGVGFIRIFNTSGGATLLYENQASNALISVAGTPEIYTSLYSESFYTLTAGISYVFDIQGKVGTAIEVLLTGGSGNPFYMFAELEVAASGPAVGYFASSQVTTTSSTITGTSFVTVDNSPAFTFTPINTGIYKVYSAIPLFETTNGAAAVGRIFNTSGGATLLQESQAISYALESLGTTGIISSGYAQSVYTLTAGTSYQFDIQARNTSTGSMSVDGTDSPFYMFAEQVGAATNGGGGGAAFPVAVGAMVTLSSAVIPGTNGVVKFDTIQDDTNSAYSTSTGLYTVVSAGRYLVSLTVNVNALAQFYVNKNSTQYPATVEFVNTSSFGSGSFVVNCALNDTIGIYITTGATVGNDDTIFSIYKMGN